ncbi:cobalamin-independent methionine synthase II family protein [Pseudonocardia endophytica]|uniref:5-methyltetrahydropteroyltriglutamate--homocysteine methyltransferase n=1 Tax=Pseudonocardia endophytica TaxID=401976 RepID=A0A4R1HK42_PSEEN|nr:cobalamin-independent methionine synthase II family protein [Pseudonocardia endophytica]TCK22228.1 5-methyltetrahydropteroyltriglutamate--homocysteine methyltransferase [Pseudonocardia endophytica]
MTILTTHVGSLPRPADLLDLINAHDRGEEVDTGELARVVERSVHDAVALQAEIGIDVPSDGEMSKIGYATYLRHRMSGFELGDAPRATPADLDAYPDYKERLHRSGATVTYQRPICRGPIAYTDTRPLETDLATLRAAVEATGGSRAFMNAPSPGIVALFQPNEYYGDEDAYLDAVAAALKTEYDAIVAAGFDLQIDAPDLGMGRHNKYKELTDEQFLARAEVLVEVLNHALRDVPRERARIHLCWGNYEGPHTYDIAVEKVAGVVLRAKPGTILCEAANPRHGHDWAGWAAEKIPDDTVFCPGVIDTTTNFVEHPGLVAERISRFTDIVGHDRVMAGTDCGFGTFAGWGGVVPELAVEKLRSLVEGAALASTNGR